MFAPILDSHLHVWDLQRLDLPWLASSAAFEPIARTFTDDDYRAATKDLGIAGALYVEVDAPPGQQRAEAEQALMLCAQPGSVLRGAVIGGHPGSEGFREHVSRLVSSPHLRGVRQVLHVPEAAQGLCLTPAFVSDVAWLGTQRLCFDLCMRAREIRDAARLAEACPDTRFVLDHCGYVAADGLDLATWRRDLEAVARRENAACKVSGLTVPEGPIESAARSLAPIVDTVLESFGPRRLLFGGNWPVCQLMGGLERWVAVVRRLVADRSPEAQRLLFHDNARRWYWGE